MLYLISNTGMDHLELVGETKVKILGLLLEKKRTAKDVATQLHIQVSAARKHLEAMAELGMVESSSITEGVGRPKKFFVLSDGARELYPNQYSNILNLLLSKMISTKQFWQVELMLEEIAREISSQTIPELGSALDPERLQLVSGALNKFGFESYVENLSADDKRNNGSEGRNPQFAITSRNCPMLKVASKHQNLVCNHFHGTLLKSALDSPNVELKNCIVMGDNVCRHVLPNHGNVARV